MQRQKFEVITPAKYDSGTNSMKFRDLMARSVFLLSYCSTKPFRSVPFSLKQPMAKTDQTYSGSLDIFLADIRLASLDDVNDGLEKKTC